MTHMVKQRLSQMRLNNGMQLLRGAHQHCHRRPNCLHLLVTSGQLCMRGPNLLHKSWQSVLQGAYLYRENLEQLITVAAIHCCTMPDASAQIHICSCGIPAEQQSRPRLLQKLACLRSRVASPQPSCFVQTIQLFSHEANAGVTLIRFLRHICRLKYMILAA